MIFRRLGLVHKNQRGFTLVEMLIAIAVTALIVGGIAMAIFQTVTVNARNSSHMTTVRQVQNAGHWISQDTQMAQEVDPAADPDGFPLTLTWTEWADSTENTVIYSITADDELKRTHTRTPGGTTEMIVARFINTDPALTKCELSGDVLTVTVTATVSDFTGETSETRVYEINPRPNI
jgi:prepilin-type N-terminal cleavage/methylation domain-containing protein